VWIAIAIVASSASAGAQDGGEALAAIAALVREGRIDGARAALGELAPAARGRPDARYLAGRLAEQDHDLRAAIDAYAAAVEPLAAALVDDARERRARLLARDGRCEEAEPLLAAIDRAAARAARAECALARGDVPGAIVALERAIAEDHEDVDRFALLLALAEAEARNGARDRALAALRRAIVERPEHPDAAHAERSFAALAGAPIEPTIEERLARATRLDEVLLHDRAVAELDAAGRPRERALLARWLHLRGMALFRSRHAYPEAARVLAQSARQGTATSIEDAFHAARALSRSGDDAGAIRAYRRLARSARQHRLGAEAEYLAAWIEMRLGRRGAARALETFLASPRAALVPAIALEARWHLALAAFRRRSYPLAAQLFGAYAREDDDPLVRARGTYWRARALTEAGNRDGAIAGYRATIRAAALHWYALLARQRLIALGADVPAPFASEPVAALAPPVGATLPDAAATLLALGLDRDARDAVRRRERALRAGSDLRSIVDVYLRIGDANRAFRLTAGREELERAAAGDAAWAWRAAYPRAFEGAVIDAARAQDLPPEMLWAIMRQESAYDPEALSYADAIGLMQLIPPTAERVARGLGVAFRREMLFDPGWNTRFGASYVRTLEETLGVPLCFAGYNAGGSRVAEWLAARGEMELDLFVEEIPYDQTRSYIRRVTSHYARYLYLRDPSAGWPELDLPERVAAPEARAPSD
jgi:soluble lytic murein transglycosylase